MNPILLASVVAPLLYAIVNYVDKFLVTKVATSKSAWTFFGLFSFIIAFIIFVWLSIGGNTVALPMKNIAMLLLSGVFQVSWVYFYFNALEGEDTSSVTPLFQFIGLFTYILGVIFLGEILAFGSVVAIALILIGGALLSYNPNKKFAFRKEAGYMILASFIISLGLVFFKKSTFGIESFGTNGIIGMSEFFISSFWMYIGMGLTALVVLAFLPSFRNDFTEMMRKNSATVWKVNVLNEVLNVLATLAFSYASLKIAVATVSALEAIQGFYVLVIGIILTKLLPKYISEDLSRKTLIFKFVAVAIMVAGGVLLAIS